MASKMSLSRLRLSPHYSALSRFHASEGASKLRLEAEDAAACEEALMICRHLDLECEVLNEISCQTRTLIVRRNELDFLDEGPPPEPAEVATRTAPGLPAQPPQKRSRQGKTEAEAEHMLSVAPAGLSSFYEALQDAFPGFRGKLAKLMVSKLHAAGYSGPCAASSSSSSSSISSGKKKKKSKKKQKKQKEKKKKKEKQKKSSGQKNEGASDGDNAAAKTDLGAEVKLEPAEDERQTQDEAKKQTSGLAEEVDVPPMDAALEAELDAELAF